jgi:hypothetical protein
MEDLKSDIKVTVKSKETEPKKEIESPKGNLDADTTKGNTGTLSHSETKPKEKLKTKGTEDKIENELKEKENMQVKKKSAAKPRKKSFKTKYDIPHDYLEYLKEHYNIVEDPVGDYERMMAEEYGDKFFDYDYENNYDKMPTYDTYLDEGDDEEHTSEEEISNSTDSHNETDSECKVCKVMESDKKLRLATIKSTILDKLGFSSSNLPNMTGKAIPKIPSLRHMIEQQDMQSDAPHQHYDDYLPEDEFYGQVKKAYTIAQKRKFSLLYLLYYQCLNIISIVYIYLLKFLVF